MPLFHGPEYIGTQDDAVFHRDRDVPIDTHAVGDLAPEFVAHSEVFP